MDIIGALSLTGIADNAEVRRASTNYARGISKYAADPWQISIAIFGTRQTHLVLIAKDHKLYLKASDAASEHYTESDPRIMGGTVKTGQLNIIAGM